MSCVPVTAWIITEHQYDPVQRMLLQFCVLQQVVFDAG